MKIKRLVKKVLGWRKEIVRKTAGGGRQEAGKVYREPTKMKIRR